MTTTTRSIARRLAVALLVAGAGAGTGSGCATLAHGRDQQIRIDSVPSGARVSVDGEEWGVTPCVVRVRRHDNHAIRIDADGYDAAGVTLTRELSGWAWANAANGGLPGLIVDAVSGGLYDLTPASISTVLLRANGEPAPPVDAPPPPTR